MPAVLRPATVRVRDTPRLTPAGDGHAKVVVGAVGGDAPAGRALYQAALQQVGVVDVLDGVARLAEGDGDRTDPHRTALELVYDEGEVVAVGPVEAEVIHALHLQRGVRGLLVYLAVGDHLGIVADALEEPVGDAGRSAAAARELARAGVGDRDAEYFRVADHNLLQVLRPVVVEPRRETEAVEQRLGHQARPGRSTHQRKAGQIHPDRAC